MPQLFTNLNISVAALVEQIALGQLALPDLQRPFVWGNVAVRDLFDSMHRGLPVGNFLFWQTGVQAGTHKIGGGGHEQAPQAVIVDGQQRLTSLYAVVKGASVLREGHCAEPIVIGFNPLDGAFAVDNAAIRKNPEFIANISEIWRRPIFPTVDAYLRRLQTARGDLHPETITRVQERISELHALTSYAFTVLQLSPSADVTDVSDVFVRINSKGKQLNQADFILTLMSVFWDSGRRRLENFCRAAHTPGDGTPSPFNHHLTPTPELLLRVSIGLAFRRARLSAVYALLRGRTLDGDETVDVKRRELFTLLEASQATVLNLQNWRDFFTCLDRAGYRSQRTISSPITAAFAYLLFLIGRTEHGLSLHDLRRPVARWFFMAALTRRYGSSNESQMESDLARLRGVSDGAGFLAVLDAMCEAVLTSDFWSIQLPNDLATPAPRSPSMLAYFAALNVNGAKALYSDHPVAELTDPALRGNRSSLERHHIFPAAFLKSIGVTDERDYNQIANFTVIEWGDNVSISNLPPKEYAPKMEARFNAALVTSAYADHALAPGWFEMSYPDFLVDRRRRMAAVIRRAFETLSGQSVQPAAPPVILSDGESDRLEFKSSLRTNMKTGDRDTRMEQAALKSIAAFLNTRGGALALGVDDAGTPTSLLAADGFADEDRALLHLSSLIRDRLGAYHALQLTSRFLDHAGQRVLLVEVLPGAAPAFVRDGTVERFYVRQGPATTELTGSAMQAYIAQRFV